MKLSLPWATIMGIIFPLLPPPYALKAQENESVERGKKIYSERICPTCHAIKGQGGDVGPSLTQVGNRRTKEWLLAWIKNPPGIKPGTIMPTVPLSDPEREDLVNFLLTNRKEIDKSVLNLPPRQAGTRLMEEYDCFACHTIADRGGRVGPQLTRVEKRRDARWLATWLKDPQKVKPGTFMPTFGFSDKEVMALSQYLSGLR